MHLLSDAFPDGGLMPPRYTADDDNHSPPVSFTEVPSTARSLALTMEDADAPFTHWIVFNLDPRTTGLAKSEIAGRARDGRNGFGELGYTGPHAVQEHRYVFRLYALDCVLPQPNGVDLDALKQAMQGHVIDCAELQTRYRCTGKPPAAPFARTGQSAPPPS